MATIPREILQRQLPSDNSEWGGCKFIINPTDDKYDWLIVYDDLPAKHSEARKNRFEKLACPAAHTMLTTSEPSTIKHYGNGFARQFGCVLTSQEAWALPHKDRIYSQAGLHWFYGLGKQHVVTLDEMLANPPLEKTKTISMMFTPKRMRHTLHHQRFNFLQNLMHLMPGIDAFGRGAQPLEDDDKANALNAYRYHVAVENYIGQHHWTEKLSDAFLGMTLPFYAGCPNAADYFPPDSFIPIDINDPEGAARIIREAIANNEYEKRLPAIMEARRRVLYEHNFFAVVAREIEKRHANVVPQSDYGTIYSRHYLRSHSVINGLQGLYGKARARIVHFFRGR